MFDRAKARLRQWQLRLQFSPTSRKAIASELHLTAWLLMTAACGYSLVERAKFLQPAGGSSACPVADCWRCFGVPDYTIAEQAFFENVVGMSVRCHGVDCAVCILWAGFSLS